jgi:hypothetical protein
METNCLRWTLRLLLLNVALAILATGCATPAMHSYNQDFNQDLRTAPNYAIADQDDNHFQVTVCQGREMVGMERIIHVKQAARMVAASEAKHRGWSDFDLNYTQEYDHGWMHVVVAEITRQNAAERQPAANQ